GRLAVPDQKGVELMASIADEFAKRGAGVIFLGSGDDMHQKLLLGVDKMFPKNFFPFIGFDAAFAQLMYAGCDFMLIPSKFEPCGLVQMMAMRYGCIPVVRRTGGLADSVENVKCAPKDCAGTGIVFQDFNQHDLREAIARACSLFQQKHLYRSVQQNAMSADFSWNASAQKYIELYQSLLL
ncbi:MAG: glycosyltransferase, partial [Patescibacteria group bacterium]